MSVVISKYYLLHAALFYAFVLVSVAFFVLKLCLTMDLVPIPLIIIKEGKKLCAGVKISW